LKPAHVDSCSIYNSIKLTTSSTSSSRKTP
jgi:hypothetical protein